MKKIIRNQVSLVIFLIVCFIFLVYSVMNTLANTGIEQEFENWPSEEIVLSNIDEVIADFKNDKINEDKVIEKIKTIIPKPSNYPKRPIEIVIPWGPGGGSDLAIRFSGKEAEKFIDAPLVYVNMPGAGSEIGTAYVYGKDPNGYTILSVNGSPIANSIFMDLPYNFVEEFTPIYSFQGPSEAFFVTKNSDFNTWDDLVAWAAKNPGKFTVATVGKTTDDQFVLWQIEEHFGIKIVNIGFESSGERRTAVLGGHIVALADSVGTVSQLLESGDLRPLLYYGSKRFVEIDPDVPCMGDYGIELMTPRWRGIAGPPGLPKEIQWYLYYMWYAATQMPEYKAYEKQSMLHYSQPWSMGPEELKEFWIKFYKAGENFVEKYGMPE